MKKIINISGATVKIGDDDGKVVSVPIASLTFSKPKVGDEVELFKEGGNYIINLAHKTIRTNFKKPKISKKSFIIAGGVLGSIVLVACTILFLPLAFDEDLRNSSSYPQYYKNLKEEKEAFANALVTCNNAAEKYMKQNGIVVEYKWDDVSVVNSRIVNDEDDNISYIYLQHVNPTGGEKEYTRGTYSYGTRYYNCYASINGKTLREVNILWDEKSK